MVDKTVQTYPMTGAEALTILFTYLKLTHQIDWSWWWVISPLLVRPFVAGVVVGLLLWVWKK